MGAGRWEIRKTDDGGPWEKAEMLDTLKLGGWVIGDQKSVVSDR
jgi:hypothetical protein